MIKSFFRFNKYRRDTVKKSIKSLYKKKGKASGGQEWVCLHCDLTFDNASMLNLHTLTHAAEDIGLQEIQKRTPDSAMADLLGNGDEGIISASGDALLMYALPDPADASLGEPGISENTENNELQCPVCKLQFASKRELVDHAAEHGKRKPPSGNPLKPHKCSKCWKAFSTAERLNKHMLCHGDERSKPMQCQVCLKRFMNNSALACHVKTHSDQKYYDCPLCKQGFDQVSALKEHVVTHAVNGLYTCPECHRSFQVRLNTLRPRQNGRRFPDGILKWNYLNENSWISIKISLKFVPMGPINDIPALVQVMAWHRPGDKPLSEPMMVSLLTHISVTRPQWVNCCHAELIYLFFFIETLCP